jgi:hypothetical protein
VAGCFEYGNEHQGSVKCGEIYDWLRNGQLLKKNPAPWSWLVKKNAVVIVKPVVHIDTTVVVLTVVLTTSVNENLWSVPVFVCLFVCLFGDCPSSSFLCNFS